MQLRIACCVLTVCAVCAEAGSTSQQSSLSLEVGAAAKLQVPRSATLTSSDPRVVEVLSNGYVIALSPGSARIDIGGAAHREISVTEPRPQLIEPATLKQYPDNRAFEIDCRKCFGSELNGSRATDPQERKNTRSNRVINPNPPIPEKPLEWALQDQTPVYDGAGVLMGTVAPTRTVNGRSIPVSMFNFGMSKVLDGRVCIYAFSVTIQPSRDIEPLLDAESKKSGVVGASAWLPLDCVINKESLVERIGLGKVRLPALPLENDRYRITGGDPAMYNTEFGELSIVKDIHFGPVPSHYLRRPSGTVNVIYSVPGFGLGGQGLDSFLISDGATFRPAKGAKVFVQPTYFPSKHPKAGQIAPQTMTFLYGAVEVKGSPLYGWVAKEALERMQ